MIYHMQCIVGDCSTLCSAFFLNVGFEFERSFGESAETFLPQNTVIQALHGFIEFELFLKNKIQQLLELVED